MKKILMISVMALAALTGRAQVVCDTVLNRVQTTPFTFAVPVADGNYRVTVTLGNKKKAGQTVVRAESRRHYFDVVTTKKGQFTDLTFTVNKHSPLIDKKAADGKLQEKAQHFTQGEVTLVRNVRLKPRELSYLNWDDSLNLSFCGPVPAVQRIKIEAAPAASPVGPTTVFLCGNSTVVDQENEPWASWGQMITRWFDAGIAISNHAESGLTARTFIAGGRLDKILTTLKAGDIVVVEFGHNDEKEKRPGDGAWYHYTYQLKVFIDQVRSKGAEIVFCTPTQRRAFANDKKTLQNTHGDFPAAMKSVAEREHVPLIDLNTMTKVFFETLGFEDSKRALVHYPMGSFPGQEKELADNTHFNPYGAYEVAKCVVMGMKQLQLPVIAHLRSDWQDFSPAQPDDWHTFKWVPAPNTELLKPDGN
jgi:lysophospholipase L1-like esterase